MSYQLPVASIGDRRAVFGPWAGLMPFLQPGPFGVPAMRAAGRRNIALDEFFYDVGSLSNPELDFLLAETNIEGSILVVFPRGRDDEIRVRKFGDYETLRAAPGRLLDRFVIAGVGSSDVGAAALARNLADYCQHPVGAIVAGYGAEDLLTEAMGGWFVMGASNRLMQLFHDREAAARWIQERFGTVMGGLDTETAHAMAAVLAGSPDSDALLRLLLDQDREIKTLLGHSKGCLSIAYALEALVLGAGRAAVEKAKAIEIVTTGAVVEFPDGFGNVRQYLGSLDWFGGMNSRLGERYVTWPGSFHHLNTALPFHMKVADILDHAAY